MYWPYAWCLIPELVFTDKKYFVKSNWWYISPPKINNIISQIYIRGKIQDKEGTVSSNFVNTL
jgi:hypothetical protein